MSNPLHRRTFLASLIGIPGLPLVGQKLNIRTNPIKQISAPANRLKTSLNAYSFNGPLSGGSLSLSELLDYCAETGFDGIDITGYYFKGYPQVPSDEVLFQIKRKAFGLGLGISGTGVRNDFTIFDKTKREQEVQLVKNWIEAAAKFGAPVVRIFAGNQKNVGIPKDQVTEWMLKDIQTCVDYGKQNGVIIGLQNHNDFIQTADQVVAMIEAINSDWLGLILDTGSYRVLNPYEEITRSIRHVVNWQIKESVLINGEEKEIDLDKLMAIIKSSAYQGYLPIETLGQGDPKPSVDTMLTKLKKAIN
jgi:sugar phosphate isomerase/epimerase